ncbi:MAG TPA: Rieske (2Fe-2S) protein [candidate division Zixibacteria bacterium]|nr:Rieske (2Fe-2S) protein [candidate division Zixibacteria bacterium]
MRYDIENPHREKGMEPMGSFVKVCKTTDIPDGKARSVEVNGKTIAIFNLQGQFYAINDVCGHRGGPLSEGELDGKIVICPWHGWRYDVTSGANELVPDLPTEKFELRVDGEDILVQV